MIRVILAVFVFGCTSTHSDGAAIGIDLGSSLSSVAIQRDGVVELIPDHLGNYFIPSAVAFVNSTIVSSVDAINDSIHDVGR